MKLIKYIIGLLIFLGILGITIFNPPQVLSPDFPFLGLLKRGFFILLVSGFLCLFRIFKGPTSSDRIVSIDMLGILIIGVCCLLSIATGRLWYMDIGIAWALQSFIATLALAKFLEGKDFDE